MSWNGRPTNAVARKREEPRPGSAVNQVLVEQWTPEQVQEYLRQTYGAKAEKIPSKNDNKGVYVERGGTWW